MPSNVSLLDFKAGYEFQGDASDVLGLNPLLVHGTGVTFPGGGGVHLDGSTGWLEADDVEAGALRDGEGIAGFLDFQSDLDNTVAHFVGGRDQEWQIQSDAGGGYYLTGFPLAGGQKFSPVNAIPANTRTFLYFDWDRAHFHSQLNAGSLGTGDALTTNLKVITGEATPSRFLLGRNRDASKTWKGTVYRLYVWARYGGALTPAEIEAMRTAPGPLWLPGRRTNLRPIVRRTYYAVYRAAPAPNLEATTGIWRVGPAAERLEKAESATDFDLLSDAVGRTSADDGITMSAPFPLPGSAQNYGPARNVIAFFDVIYAAWDPTAGHALQLWQRQYAQPPTTNHLCLRWGPDGINWSDYLEIQYEAGTHFDIDDPFNTGYFGKNECGPGPFGGHAFAFTAAGKLILPLGQVNDYTDPQNAARDWKLGAKLAIGTWNGSTYTFTFSNTINIPHGTVGQPGGSVRGLIEPTAIELTPGGRILIVFRTEEGHPYYSYSDDGGVTLAPAARWTFADGGLIDMCSTCPNLYADPDIGKVYFQAGLTFPGIVPPNAGNADDPRHPLVVGEVDLVSGLLKRETLTTQLYRSGDRTTLANPADLALLPGSDTAMLPDAVAYGGDLAFLRRFGHRGEYEALFGRRNENPAQPGKADCYKLRWQHLDPLATAGVETVTFAGVFHYFLIRRGGLYWNPMTLAWGPLGTGAARADCCTGLTQAAGNSTGAFLPPAAGPVELVPYVMAGFQPADGDTAGDAVTVDIAAPARPTGCSAVLAGTA